jgi:hypothetical protein
VRIACEPAAKRKRGFIMNVHSIHSMRVVLGTLAAVALLTAATAAASSTPITSEQFAPDWQSHARPLIRLGVAPSPSQTSWFVPATLPRGRYLLVNRTGGKAEVIDGYQFEVTNDSARNIYMLLQAGYGDVEAIPVADVPVVKARREIVPMN